MAGRGEGKSGGAESIAGHRQYDYHLVRTCPSLYSRNSAWCSSMLFWQRCSAWHLVLRRPHSTGAARMPVLSTVIPTLPQRQPMLLTASLLHASNPVPHITGLLRHGPACLSSTRAGPPLKAFLLVQNANLVLTADRSGRPKGKEPTGEPETLSGRRLPKMGDRAAAAAPEELDELKKRKAQQCGPLLRRHRRPVRCDAADRAQHSKAQRCCMYGASVLCTSACRSGQAKSHNAHTCMCAIASVLLLCGARWQRQSQDLVAELLVTFPKAVHGPRICTISPCLGAQRAACCRRPAPGEEAAPAKRTKAASVLDAEAYVTYHPKSRDTKLAYRSLLLFVQVWGFSVCMHLDLCACSDMAG